MARAKAIDLIVGSTDDTKTATATAIRAAATTTGVACLSGVVGVGGGLIMTPVLLKVVRLPPRVAIRTMTVVGVATTVCALVGRLGTASFPPLHAGIAVVVGAAVGGVLGAPPGNVGQVIAAARSVTGRNL